MIEMTADCTGDPNWVPLVMPDTYSGMGTFLLLDIDRGDCVNYGLAVVEPGEPRSAGRCGN